MNSIFYKKLTLPIEVQLLTPLIFNKYNFSKLNLTYIRIFTFMLTIVCTNIIMILIFPTTFKQPLFRIIFFILTTFHNEQHPCKHVRVYDGIALKNQ